MPSKPANRWQPAVHAEVPKKAMPLLKAVAAETDAINMAESTPVADATMVVDEGTREQEKHEQPEGGGSGDRCN